MFEQRHSEGILMIFIIIGLSVVYVTSSIFLSNILKNSIWESVPYLKNFNDTRLSVLKHAQDPLQANYLVIRISDVFTLCLH